MSDSNLPREPNPEPNEWQDLILRYLRIRYQHDLVPVPDENRGDAGLEAFARDGSCYQCYAPENNPTPRERYEHCRNKITRDIGKFCDNRDILGKLLRNTPIRRWVFVIPRHDNKDLVVHAEKKTQEVRLKKLPYTTHDFAIQIETEDFFELERNALVDSGLRKLHIIPDNVVDSDVQAYVEAHSAQITKLERKLAKLKHPRSKRNYLKALMLKRFLQGENALAQMRQHTELYERIAQCRTFRQDILHEKSLLSTTDPNVTLERTIEQFASELAETARGIDRHTAELLARASAAAWLLECALDFPDDEDEPQ